ncbi:hypothetical protein TNCV_2067691 [Trichonephila clavipes]|uniref:Uncharacterized protein n=1 Tax=Trichonephila clavipes TaxID=2585209 RepID=A0A8X6W2V6_TRICX|nr:hypothetical protein TNCV_2067691 [Trichonephila clavipes]
MPNVDKMSYHPELLKQLTLDKILSFLTNVWRSIAKIGSCAIKPYTHSLTHSLTGGLLGNEVADDLAKAATSIPVDPEDHVVLTSTQIYSRAK